MPRQSGKLMRQRIEQAIAELTAQNGRPPTNREIGMKVGVNSTGHIEYHLRCMREEGIISHEPRKSRGITLLRAAETPVTMRVRLAGEIAAGQMIQANQETDFIDLTEGLAYSGNVFALRVKGQSMIEDHIDDGDIVIVRQQSSAENGDTVVALVIGKDSPTEGVATLKRFYREKGTKVRLQPRNAAMPPIIVDSADLTIQGKVVAVFRQV